VTETLIVLFDFNHWWLLLIDDCLEDKRLSELFSVVLCATVVHSHVLRYEQFLQVY